jgi:hypothetical protein
MRFQFYALVAFAACVSAQNTTTESGTNVTVISSGGSQGGGLTNVTGLGAAASVGRSVGGMAAALAAVVAAGLV